MPRKKNITVNLENVDGAFMVLSIYTNDSLMWQHVIVGKIIAAEDLSTQTLLMLEDGHTLTIPVPVNLFGDALAAYVKRVKSGS